MSQIEARRLQASILVILNATAGRANRTGLEKALATLPGAVIATPATACEARQTAERAAMSGTPCVVAAGGDGTIAAVAAGLFGSPSRLGIMPLGTANVLARELGIPLDLQAAAHTLLDGCDVPIHPMLLTDGTGLTAMHMQMVGVGFDGAVVRALDGRLKRAMGRAAYVLQTLRELPQYDFPQIRFKLEDGPAEEAAGLLIMNGRYYGGSFIVAPDASPTSNDLTILVQKQATRTALLRTCLALPLDFLARQPFIATRKGRSIRIEGTAPVQADGDACMPLPITIHSAGEALHVRVPAGSH